MEAAVVRVVQGVPVVRVVVRLTDSRVPTAGMAAAPCCYPRGV